MALMPAPKTKPAAGLPGQFQNMEEWNAFTAFVSGTQTKAIGFGHPVSITDTPAGDGTVAVKALATTEVFAGITRENVTTGNASDQTVYADGDVISVATKGVIFVMAGGSVSAGGKVFFDPSTNKYVGSAGAGILPLPNCEFDQDGTADNVVPIRLNVIPGGSAVTAGT